MCECGGCLTECPCGDQCCEYCGCRTEEHAEDSDLIAEFRKRDESQNRIRERLTAELAEARARVAAVERALDEMERRAAWLRSQDCRGQAAALEQEARSLRAALAAASPPEEMPTTEYATTQPMRQSSNSGHGQFGTMTNAASPVPPPEGQR